jgi:hypothetical protein
VKRHHIASLTAILVLDVLVAGCSAAPRGGLSGPPPAPGVTADTAQAGTPATPRATMAPPAANAHSSQSIPTGDPACANDVLLRFVRSIMDKPATGFTVDRAEIAACRNGYARVFVVPRKTNPPVEGDQLFLKKVDSGWRVVDQGAGIDCGDSNVKPATAVACAALR